MHLRFSQDIQALLEKLAAQPLTLKDILVETSERSFSLMIGLLCLPFLLPTLPGFTTILGSACLLISLQMALGRRSLWLPRQIAQFRFPRGLTLQLLKHLHRVSGWLEKVVRPRWRKLAESPYVWRINGLCISWLTLLLMAPLPFTNSIFTISILLFVVATLEADGVLMCVAYGVTVLATILFGTLIYWVWRSPDWLPNVLSVS